MEYEMTIDGVPAYLKKSSRSGSVSRTTDAAAYSSSSSFEAREYHRMVKHCNIACSE